MTGPLPAAPAMRWLAWLRRWLLAGCACLLLPCAVLAADGKAGQDADANAARYLTSLEYRLMRDRYGPVLATTRGMHVDVLVVDGEHFRCMSFDRRNYFQSCMLKERPMQLALEYTRGLVAGLRFLPEPPQRMLLVGLGGGSIPKAIMAYFPDAQLDVVELDAAVVQTAQQWFDFLPNEQITIHEMDARVFARQQLRQGGPPYDLIMLDAFDNEYVPEHLLTVEFLRQINQLLSPHGVVAANTFSRGRLQPHEEATWQSVFPHLQRSRRFMNDILYAAQHELHANPNDPLLDVVTGPWELHQPLPVPPSTARPLTDQWSPTNILRQLPY